MDHRTVDRIVDEINAAHGLDLVPVARCAGGCHGGAWRVRDAAGRPAVLKWTAPTEPAPTGSAGTGPAATRPAATGPGGPGPTPSRLAAAVASARAAGYPTPAWLAAGTTAGGTAYHVQEFVPGVPATPLTVAGARLLVEVLDRQAGLRPDTGRDWSARVRAAAYDETGPRRAVRALGRRGAALVDRYDRLLAGCGTVPLPGGDLVHGDFNTCNVMLRDGRVSGVVDIADLGSGTRAVDHACLLREAYVEGYGEAVARVLRQAGERVAGPAVLAVCAAATAFTIVGFKLHHMPHQLGTTLDGLHRLADDLT